MGGNATSRSIKVGGTVVDHLSVESSRKRVCFCNWCTRVCDCVNYLRKSLRNWWTRQALYIWWVNRSYKKALKNYNVSHVLEKTAGQDNIIGQGLLSKIRRYRITVKDAGEEVPSGVRLTNDGKENLPASRHYAPVFRVQEIAYKTIDGSNPAHEYGGGVNIEENTAKRVAEESLRRERKALAALDHPNIIKPVIIEGNSWQAETMTVIAIRSLSEAEKQELATAVKESGDIREGDQIDFEVVESVKTRPAGIPLSLAKTTLKQKIMTGSLTDKEKDNVVRAMIGAISCAHQRGYAHLDINPNNILQQDDVWLLADWGAAHHYSEMYKGDMAFMPVYSSDGDDYFFGTRSYLSPQMHARLSLMKMRPDKAAVILKAIKARSRQYRLFQTDARAADAYSLGIVLFELLTRENITPERLINIPLRSIESVFQQNVDKLLQEHEKSLGKYHEIVSLLLKSKCSDRISVIEADSMLCRVPIAQ